MKSFHFPGTYSDGTGDEVIEWDVVAIDRPYGPNFEIHTTIRKVEFSGFSFDSLDPVDLSAAEEVNLQIGGTGLEHCVLTGKLPVRLESERVVDSSISFSLDLRSSALQNVAAPRNLNLTVFVDQQVFTVDDDWFEDGLINLEKAMPAGTRLRCCVTCLYSDYSPGGHGLIGILCHRGAKEQYLAVRSKADYWQVPVTEEVPETHLCDEYERRRPGTGYRG
jgi:hypothetical protein